jgi:hypothetical protein
VFKKIGLAVLLGVTWPVLIAFALMTVVGHFALQGWLLDALVRLHAWARTGVPQHVAATLACIAAAGIALFFRLRRRAFYGAVEITSAIVALWLVLGSELSALSTFGTVVGSVFVIVRGVDNLRQGLSEYFRQAATQATPAPAATPATAAPSVPVS